MDSIREIIIDSLEKIWFQLNLLFDLENSTAYLVIKPFFRNIAGDPLVFIVTLLALFLIPYVMIRVRRNTVVQGKKAERLLNKLEKERSIEIPEEELELPEPESAEYDNITDSFMEENRIVENEAPLIEQETGDPELEFLKDLGLDSMYTKSYSMEDTSEIMESEEQPFSAEVSEEAIERTEDFASSWEFKKEEGSDEPVIAQLAEENLMSQNFNDELPQNYDTPSSETPNIEVPTPEDDPVIEETPDENLDRVKTIDELTRQMEATIENISNQLIDEDIEDINISTIPSEVMDIYEASSVYNTAPFFAEHPGREEFDSENSYSFEEEEPAITTPIPSLEINNPSSSDADEDQKNDSLDDPVPAEKFTYSEEKNELNIADTGLKKVLGFPFDDDEDDEEKLKVNSDPLDANTFEAETEAPAMSTSELRYPKNLEQSEILTPDEPAEVPETNISETVDTEITSEEEPHSYETGTSATKPAMDTESSENKTKHLVDRLENFQKHLEKRLTALESTLEKRKMGHEG